jgi:hypothetical protein
MGSMTLQSTKEGGTGVVLKNVWLVPNLWYNLYSVTKAEESQKEIEHRSKNGKLKISLKGTLLLTASRKGGHYYLDVTIPGRESAVANTARGKAKEIPAENLELLDRRLGHISFGAIKKLEGMSKGMKIRDPESDFGIYSCGACIMGKQHRTINRGNEIREPRLGLVHVDLVELDELDYDGNRFLLTMLEDYHHIC